MWTYVPKFLAYNALGLKKLYDQNFHDWILIPIHFINNPFGISFKTSILHQFSNFYANILQSWEINFSHFSYTLSCIRSQFLWLTILLQLITILFTLKNFRVTILTLLISWNHIEREFQLANNLYNKFTQT